MRILFCDDDTAILEQLQRDVQDYFESHHLPLPEFAAYTNGDTLLEQETGKVDFAFLDVEMPGQNGIQIGAKLTERNPKLKVFIVTSYSEYLDEAMRFHVFRYLSKPLRKSRLFSNLDDALYQYHLETTDIPVETKTGVKVYTTDEILCVEGLRRKVLIHTVDGPLESVQPIEYWKHLLEYPCFYQAYRSFIINMRHVVSFDQTLIHLRHNEQVLKAYLARRKYGEFKSRFLLYKESMR